MLHISTVMMYIYTAKTCTRPQKLGVIIGFYIVETKVK